MDDKYFINNFTKPVEIKNIMTIENYNKINNIVNNLFTNDLNNGINTYFISIQSNNNYNTNYLNNLILSIYTNKNNNILLINKNLKKTNIKQDLNTLLKLYNINEKDYNINIKNNSIIVVLKDNKNKINHKDFNWNDKFIFITNNEDNTRNKSIKINNYYLHNKYEVYLEQYKYNNTNLLEIIKMI